MFDKVELIIHHGGNFKCVPESMYVGGQVDVLSIDPDLICYPHLMKCLKTGSYGNIKALYYKKPSQCMKSLRELFDDKSTLDLIRLATSCGKCDIFVEHGLDEVELVELLPAPEAFEPNISVEQQPDMPDKEMEVDTDVNVEGQVPNEAAGMEVPERGEASLHNDGQVEDDDSHDETDEVEERGGEYDGTTNKEGEDTDYSWKPEEADTDDSWMEDASETDDSEHEETENEELFDNEVASDHTATQMGGTRAEESENEEVSTEYDSSNPNSYMTEEEDDDGTSKRASKRYGSFNPESEVPKFEVGMYFEDGKQFKKAVIKYVVFEKRDLYFKKNEPGRVRVKCGKKCPFSLTGSWVERLQCFQVKVFKEGHNCNLRYRLRIVCTKWVADMYSDKVAENPSIGAVELKRLIKAEYKLNVSESMASRALKCIEEKNETAFKEQFKKIRNYAEECLQSIPNSTIIISTVRVVPDAPSVFQRIYVCFGPVKKGFLEGCRKVIGVDGCFLKGQMKGEILSAVGRDANNQMYPIAWAVVEIENTYSWTWFLDLLYKDLDVTAPDEWTFISDQQKGLANALSRVFPNAEHRNCARHIHANWSKTHRGMNLKKLFWLCAKSTCERQLEANLAELDKVNVQAGKDLRKYPFKLWCKAFFRDEVKCDTVENNLLEAFNSTLLKCRSKPLIPMLEDIRVATMKRIAKKRKYVLKWPGPFGPVIMKKLNANIVASEGWNVDFNGDDGYEIKKGRAQFKVSLQKKSCSCRRWDLCGIPCAHVICAIYDKGEEAESYVDWCYSKEVYKKTYSYTLHPINGELLWPRTQFEEILPPLPKKMSGRPKKK
ncbi:unnamed protein product [Cuscuta epithymum]|nr:unnamed protein product [Cuscuta epithymum]